MRSIAVSWPNSSSFPDDRGVGVLVSPGDELVEDDAGHVEVGRGRGEAITAVVAVGRAEEHEVPGGGGGANSGRGGGGGRRGPPRHSRGGEGGRGQRRRRNGVGCFPGGGRGRVLIGHDGSQGTSLRTKGAQKIKSFPFISDTPFSAMVCPVFGVRLSGSPYAVYSTRFPLSPTCSGTLSLPPPPPPSSLPSRRPRPRPRPQLRHGIE